MMPRELGPFDKVAHFGMYAVLASLVTIAVRGQSALVRTVVLTIAAIAVFAAVDEWHQKFIPGRSTELADWVADSLGGITGVIAASLLNRRKKEAPPA
jgi:VanZ family protein